jgi:hypothetical protein
VYYELDLGLNHVVRKHSDPLDDVANYLITGMLARNDILLKALQFYDFQVLFCYDISGAQYSSVPSM